MKSYFSSVMSAIYLTSLVAGPAHAQQQPQQQTCAQVPQSVDQCGQLWTSLQKEVQDPNTQKVKDSAGNEQYPSAVKLDAVLEGLKDCQLELSGRKKAAVDGDYTDGWKALDQSTSNFGQASNNLQQQGVASFNGAQGNMIGKGGAKANAGLAGQKFTSCGLEGAQLVAGLFSLKQYSASCRMAIEQAMDKSLQDPALSKVKEIKTHTDANLASVDRQIAEEQKVNPIPTDTVAMKQGPSTCADLAPFCAKMLQAANGMKDTSVNTAQKLNQNSIPGMSGGADLMDKAMAGIGAGVAAAATAFQAKKAGETPKNADGTPDNKPKTADPPAKPQVASNTTDKKATDGAGEGDPLAPAGDPSIIVGSGTSPAGVPSGLTNSTLPTDCKADATGADCSTVGATGRGDGTSTIASALTGNSKANPSDPAAAADGAISATGRSALVGSGSGGGSKPPLLSGAYSSAGNRGLLGGQEKDPATDVSPASMDTNSVSSRALFVRIGKKAVNCYLPESQNQYYNHSDCVDARAKAAAAADASAGSASAAAARKQKALAGVPASAKLAPVKPSR